MKRFPRTQTIVTVLALIGYVSTGFFGVYFLREDATAIGIALLAVALIGIPTLIRWGRQFR